MAFVACDKDGSEWIYSAKPFRVSDRLWFPSDIHRDCIELPKGSIRKLIGRELRMMKDRIHPNLRAIIDNMTEEQREAVSKKLAEPSDVGYEEMQQRLKEAFAPMQPEATISGWVARDSTIAGNNLYFYRNEVIRTNYHWNYKDPRKPIGEMLLLPVDLFPSLTWESDPIEVKITIKPKKQ